MPEIDARAARRRFGRAAATYADAARLEGEVGARMLERLEVVRVAPARILDAGCGPAPQARALARRYPGAALVALDFSLPMLALARRALGWRARLRGARMLAVCGALERLPLAAGSIGLAWSNMALHWAADTHAALAELGRVLVPGGLLMFSTLGPDTLKELREAAGAAQVHAFIDMHDLGDALVAAGFAAPVMDAEFVTLTYPDPDGLFADLRRSGQTSARADRPRGLRGRHFLERTRTALVAQARGGRIPLTYEVVYGHAWKGEKRHPADGRAVIRTDQLRHKNR